MLRPLAAAVLLAALPAAAQTLTTAAEVRPILGMTRGNWLALNAEPGRDLLYFTHLLAWRCGLDEIRYGINSPNVTHVLTMEPCHEGTASPNALTTMLPYMVLGAGEVQQVTIELIYDDGTSETAGFARAAILMP
jgi:hypothetical protein